MKRGALALSGVVAMVAGVWLAGPGSARGDAPAAAGGMTYERLLGERAGTIVTIKFVLKMSGGMFGGEDQEMEIFGTMIDPKGMVLASNTELGGIFSRFAGDEMKTTPTDIKVMVGDDTQGVEAKFIARDTELDLAWLQIEKPVEGGYAFVDLADSSTPELGDTLLSVHRLGKFFDRAAHVAEGKLGGMVKKPRSLLLDATGGSLSFGLPVYDAGGKAVGVCALILPEQEEMQAMLGGGMMGSGMRDLMNGMILPASEVVAATKRVREMAAEGKDEAPGKDAPGGEAGQDPGGKE